MAEVVVNGQRRPLEPGTVVADLVAATLTEPDRDGIAVAVNEQVVRRDEWTLRRIEAEDHVEIIVAFPGG